MSTPTQLTSELAAAIRGAIEARPDERIGVAKISDAANTHEYQMGPH